MKDNHVIKFSTEKSLTAVLAALQLAVAANHFVIAQQLPKADQKLEETIMNQETGNK